MRGLGHCGEKRGCPLGLLVFRGKPGCPEKGGAAVGTAGRLLIYLLGQSINQLYRGGGTVYYEYAIKRQVARLMA